MGAIQSLFPTLIYQAPLQSKAVATRELNRQLLREAMQFAEDDEAGQRWSDRNYPGGYTSYGSLCRLQTVSPTFARLGQLLGRHIKRYARELALDLRARELVMTDCWVNIMPAGVGHSLHLHPLSTVSGIYYVRTPPSSAALKFEDPRLDRFMAAPPRRADAAPTLQPWRTVRPRAGECILFESWLRHEVPVNQSRADRVSISFNFNWF